MGKEDSGFILIDKKVLEALKPQFSPKTKKEVDEVEVFRCRVCGSKTYHKVTESKTIFGPGGQTKTLYYVCDNCSVLFLDPERFSK